MLVITKNHLFLPYLFLMAMTFYAQTLQAQRGPRLEGQNNKYSRIRDFSPGSLAKVLNIRTVLEQGLRENPYQLIRQHERDILQVGWKNTFSSFWFPHIAFTFNTDNQKIHHLVGNGVGGVVKSSTSKTPVGAVGLTLGEWTVFNWGKDYLKFQNDQNSYRRGRERLTEKKRLLKHDLIRQYFNLARLKHFRKIAKAQLQHISFIYRLTKERVSLRKIKKQEFYEVRSEYLKAQNHFHNMELSISEANKIMADLMGDDLSTTYQIEESLRFKQLFTPLHEAIQSALLFYPNVKEAKHALENSRRDYEVSLKDNLPLPKFSVNLGTYTYGFNRNSSHLNYETQPGNTNIELVASINMTWTILGKDGLFNLRKKEISYAHKKISELKFYNSKRSVEMSIRMLYQSIKHLENQREISVVQLENTQKTFDIVLDNYVSGKTSFHKFRDAWENLQESEHAEDNSRYKHLLKKVELAFLMGLEDLPGTPFENLAKQELDK